MEKVYIAGSLFSEAQRNQRVKEGNMIESKGFDVYNPILAPCNDKSKLPTAKSIFYMDTDKVLDADIITADLSDNDMGMACELGIAWCCNAIAQAIKEGLTPEEVIEMFKPKRILCVSSDIRQDTAHEYRGIYIPWGINQYMIGMLEDADAKFYKQFNDLLTDI